VRCPAWMRPGLVPPDGVKGAAGGPAAGHDRGVLPVTPFTSWCLVPGYKSGAGGNHAGWVLSLRARRSDSVFPAPPPGSFRLVHALGRSRGRTVPCAAWRLRPARPAVTARR